MILMNRPYAGFAAGAIVEFSAELEAALIAQGFAVTSSGPVTPGAQATNGLGPNTLLPLIVGTAACAIGAATVVITNPLIGTNTKGFAQVSQAAADATALRVERVSCAAGAMTITLTANATAATEVSWMAVLG